MTVITSCHFSNHKIKPESNHKKKKTWNKHKHTKVKQQDTKCVNRVIKEDIQKYVTTNENETKMIQNHLNTAKAVLRGKYIATQDNLNK